MEEIDIVFTKLMSTRVELDRLQKQLYDLSSDRFIAKFKELMTLDIDEFNIDNQILVKELLDKIERITYDQESYKFWNNNELLFKLADYEHDRDDHNTRLSHTDKLNNIEKKLLKTRIEYHCDWSSFDYSMREIYYELQ